MKKILIVADEPGWCFESHALQIKNRLTEYHIDIAFHRQNIAEMSRRYDLIYVMDPMPLIYGYPHPDKTILGLRNEFLYREHPNGARGLYLNGFPGRCVSLNRCKILHVVNHSQIDVFKDIVKCKLLLSQHGVDDNIFNVNKYVRTNNDILTIGMSGRDSNNKAFGMVKSSCNKLGLKFLSAQYGRAKIPKDKMPLFYNSIDIYVVLSDSEGLHNGSLESGSMKTPIISTRCGEIEHIIKDGKNGLLIDRNVESLVVALNKMKDKDLREGMGNKFYEEIVKNWTWKVRIEDFRKMFKEFFNE